MGMRGLNASASASRGPMRRRPWRALLGLLMGPLVLAAMLVALVAVAFNLWPTLNRMSEWGD